MADNDRDTLAEWLAATGTNPRFSHEHNPPSEQPDEQHTDQ